MQSATNNAGCHGTLHFRSSDVEFPLPDVQFFSDHKGRETWMLESQIIMWRALTLLGCKHLQTCHAADWSKRKGAVHQVRLPGAETRTATMLEGSCLRLHDCDSQWLLAGLFYRVVKGVEALGSTRD